MAPCRRCLVVVAVLAVSSDAFSTKCSRRLPDLQPPTEKLSSSHIRRQIFRDVLSSAILVGGTVVVQNDGAFADDSTPISIEMKSFVDPQGLFALNVPKRFFVIRRSAKGDLPNEKGQGRRGSSIFTAGDMAKAEVVAVERFPTAVLLEENGIAAIGDLSTIKAIGDPATVANLIAIRRDKEKGGNSKAKVVPDSIVVSPDGKELKFQLRDELSVQKPELLLEQTGVSQLFRVTSAKASLGSDDDNMLAVFASALEADWNSPDGTALQTTVDSFKPLKPVQ